MVRQCECHHKSGLTFRCYYGHQTTTIIIYRRSIPNEFPNCALQVNVATQSFPLSSQLSQKFSKQNASNNMTDLCTLAST